MESWQQDMWNGEALTGREERRTDGPGMPVFDRRQPLARASRGIGIASLFATLFMPVIMPFVMAPVAIVLAVLSEGSGTKMPGAAKAGAVCAAISLAVNILLFAAVIVMIVRILTEPAFFAEMDALFRSLYGYGLQEVLGPLMQQ